MKKENPPLSLGRFSAVWIILVATALFLAFRGSFESVPAHRQLENFPRELQGWVGRDLPLEADTLQILGAGDFLNRDYENVSSPEFIGLFVAYYPSQRTGDTLHSPQHCLPGAGWTPLRSDNIQIVSADAPKQSRVVTANRFVFAKGTEHVFVLYWYQAHGRTTASEYWAKFYLVRDSIAMHRSDGAIVRLDTPISNPSDPSDEARAEARTVDFAKKVLAPLDDYLPR
jgi:EpsI family protein